MKKLFLSILIACCGLLTFGQRFEKREIEQLMKAFISSYLERNNSMNKLIVAPLKTSDLVNQGCNLYKTVFWNKIKSEYNFLDTLTTNEFIDRSKEFFIPNKISYYNIFLKNNNQIESKIDSLKAYSLLVTLSPFVINKDANKIVILCHFENQGTTSVEFRKDHSGKWLFYSDVTECME